MLYRALVALTHVASQLIYRWLPPPKTIDMGEVARESLDLGIAQALPGTHATWLELIAAERKREVSRLPWLSRYLERFDPAGLRLAAAAAEHLRCVEQGGATYVLWGDSMYPAGLRHLADPPLALSVLGEPSLFHEPAISVVGSRKASSFAARESFALGEALATMGITVVSGGAFGCDIAAHQGVVTTKRVPAPAACVFAGGLASMYPAANRPLFAKLRQAGGLLISERLWFAPCRPMDFTARNRIIAGLSNVTLIMQAADRSGALVTARLALDQGKDVGVLRHPDGDVRARGSATLLADGAWGFSSARDLLERANLAAASPSHSDPKGEPRAGLQGDLAPSLLPWG